MDLDILRYFMVVAKTQHITKASKILNISQPSLSLAIRRLEAEIGFELFHRKKRSIELNEYGAIFLEHVTAADKEFNAGLVRMHEMKKIQQNFISLCVPTSSTKQQLMDVLLREGFNLKFFSLPNNWQKALLEDQIDLITTIEECVLPQVDRVTLRQMKLAFVCSKNHPLARQKRVAVADINNYPFSSTSTQHTPLVCAKKQLTAAGLNPHVTFFGNNTADILYSVASSERLALVIKSHLPARHELHILDVEGVEITLPLYLYWKTNNAKFSLTHAIQYIKEFYSHLED